MQCSSALKECGESIRVAFPILSQTVIQSDLLQLSFVFLMHSMLGFLLEMHGECSDEDGISEMLKWAGVMLRRMDRRERRLKSWKFRKAVWGTGYRAQHPWGGITGEVQRDVGSSQFPFDFSKPAVNPQLFLGWEVRCTHPQEGPWPAPAATSRVTSPLLPPILREQLCSVGVHTGNW